MQLVLPKGKVKMVIAFSAAIPEAQSFLGMEITINNQLRSIAADSVTVQHILDMEVPRRQKGIAVAVNNVIVPKAEWESYPVLSQDKIVIIKATQGG